MIKSVFMYKKIKGIAAIVIFSAIAVFFIFGCDNGGGGQRTDPVFQAEVSQALDAIEQHGLPDWADWGRAHRSSIINAECGGGYAYTLFSGAMVWILLSDRWRTEIGTRDRGEILLEEIYHARTGIITHTAELAALLDVYGKGEHG